MRKHLNYADAAHKAMGQLGRIMSVNDLPSKKESGQLIRKAMDLNDKLEGGPARPRARQKVKPEAKVPADLAAALDKHPAASATFSAFSPSHRREYIEWITEAKRPETREKRLQLTLEMLADGKSRHWKYQKC
jgi:uncharacterized protein YdeI (YjbR/CyaY-like superfamily)